MDNQFFEKPILNSPYEYPTRHWELDDQGQPTQKIIESRRSAEFITPIPKPMKRKRAAEQQQMVFDEGKGLSTQDQQYDPTAIINELRQHVDRWRSLPNPNDWQVTPETARLLQYWRHHRFNNIRPFFCQVEAVETAGKQGRLGDSIRCVVSVSMLTEGWDANTVTHVLGVRAFGTQLLCEQVIGRALRRQSYDLNEENRFNVEYADVLGIPFDFTAKPVIAPPQPPRETIHVKAVRPDRDHLEIRFPRVAGYRVELPEDRLTAEFNNDSVFELTPEHVGATETQNAGIIGEKVNLDLVHTGDVRPSQVIYELTSHLLLTKWRDPDGDPLLHLFGQLKRITRQWLDNYLVCKGGTYPAQLKYKTLADIACERISNAIILAGTTEDRPIKAVLDPYNPTGSTIHVNFNTSKTNRWQTDARRCHINWIILDSDWEAEFCRVAEAHPRVKAYVKNHNLGLEAPYRYGSEMRTYIPDFIVLIDDGHDDPLHLIVEIKGFRREDAKDKKATMETYWVPGVNNLGKYGRWAFAEFTEVYRIEADFEKKVEAEFNNMIDSIMNAEK